ncbi:MAG: alanine dehydrogenase [Candidatus Krumholzibacteria bacterium]|nr:alanine dehydrogenase [Candidatus Krumholzibacteria bacterium]
MSKEMTMGMVGSSTKENEKRVAIHPAHFHLIEAEARRRIYVEKDYGKRFRIGDDQIARDVAGLMTREELFEKCDIIMIFKPTAADFPFFREEQVIWGALHLVQGDAITQTMVDKKLTGIAMESMFIWKNERDTDVWIFHTQSQFAGYCSVLHSLQLLGIKGWHDQPKKAAVISFGGAGRGAVHALMGLEFTDITVFTQRPPISVLGTIPTVKYGQYARRQGSQEAMAVLADGTRIPFAEELAKYDIIVNCVLQDTDKPITFIHNKDLDTLRPGTLIVDVSCDTEMGFEFARPTSFDDPLLTFGDRISYYAVDHSPSLLYDTASLEHSKTAWPHVKDVLDGEAGWTRNPTVGKAIEVKNGTIVNPKILSFQNREPVYPHRRRS